MFVPYMYAMSGCSFPCIATVAFWSELSLFTYCIVTWIWPSCSVLNASRIAWSDRFSTA